MDKYDRRSMRQELRLIWRRGRQVWRLVPARHKAALGGAALLMAVTSAANTAIPVLLGRLVGRLEQLKHDVGAGSLPDALFRVALTYLAAIGAVYLLREAVHVVRRYLSRTRVRASTVT